MIGQNLLAKGSCFSMFYQNYNKNNINPTLSRCKGLENGKKIVAFQLS